MRRNSKSIFNRRTLAVLLSLLMFAGTPAGAFAVEEPAEKAEGISAQEEILANEVTEVKKADSVEELSEESNRADNDAFFIIDAKDNSLDGSLADEEITNDVEQVLSGRAGAESKQSDVIDTLENSGYYKATEGKGSEVEVTSKFAYQRLRLDAPYTDELYAYGAVNAVYHDGYYLLSYDSEEATKVAYDALHEEYGDSVIADIPLKLSSIQSPNGALGWGTEFMHMDSEQKNGTFVRDVKVAVIDSGINRAHHIFDGTTIAQGRDFVNGDSDPADDNGHGTMVAGIIAESTPQEVSIIPVKAMGKKGEGSLFDIMMGIKYACDQGADVINLSLGGDVDEETFTELNKHFRYFNSVLICASGNDGNDENIKGDLDKTDVNMIPAELDSTICVGAINSECKRCSFSNYGSAVDFAAPGSEVRLANYENVYGYAIGDGTSFAAPYVTAIAAIMMAEGETRDIKASLAEISYDIDNNGKDDQFGHGIPMFESDKTYDATFDPKVISPALTLSKNSFTYNGKEHIPDVTVKDGLTVLRPGRDYDITYSADRKNVGTHSIKVTLRGYYRGSASASYKITKAANTLYIKAKTANLSKSKLKKKAQVLSVGKLLTVSKAQGRVTYAKVSGSKKLSINKTTGKVTVKKKTNKGTYKMKVRVSAAGNGNYNAANKYVTLTIKVK